MKGLLSFAALSLVLGEASAHYIFQQLSTGGTKHPMWKYIRQHTNYNSPVVDLNSNDLRCNLGADSGRNTETVTVAAGSSMTFHLDTPVYHQGPVSVYMSKAPGSVRDYDGSGGWFKIQDWGPTFNGGNAQWKLDDSYTFSIPSCIPPGDYLVRIQSLGIHNPWPAGVPQFYISCAQVTVTGGGNASPGPLASIPGAFKETDPGYTANIYNNFRSYTVPGPSVFTCSGNGGGSNPNPNPGNPGTPTTLITTQAPAPTTPPSCTVAKWGQCGGQGYTGCTNCAAGSTCNQQNPYYHQCV
ncbi:hypothetical protein VTJ49DRAFT_7725 [Mycothermus thermophilus]|uniref:lytic cellulose monooxygenase (C4-dehydrogenating) n=1 Tax=Humicola insolens TaxID=85995 RepID=A0ABR3VI79_HUMIN